MKKLHCLTGEKSKYVMLKDYGNTTGYVVLMISSTDTFVKTDKRIFSEKEFINLYGYDMKHTIEDINKAFIFKSK